MSSPDLAWLADGLATVMIGTAAYCAARLVYARLRRCRTEHDTDTVHLLMGVAMAGMLVPRLAILPMTGWGPVTWAVIFALSGTWFAARIARPLLTVSRRRAVATRSGDGDQDTRRSDLLRARAEAGAAVKHHVPHLVACLAMVYMFLAPPDASGHPSGMGAAAEAASGMAAMAGAAATGLRWPTLGLAFALFLVGYAVTSADRLPFGRNVTVGRSPDAVVATAAPGGSAPFRSWGSPRSASPTSTVHQACFGAATSGDTQDRQMAAPGGVEQAGGCPMHSSASDVIAPRAAICCHIAMSVTMAYMLIILL